MSWRAAVGERPSLEDALATCGRYLQLCLVSTDASFTA